MKKILVIDGNSIINRAFYGVRPLLTKSGKYTNAIFGMINIISRQLSAIKPDYAAVAFDLKAPTFRHKMYEGYKAKRHPTPPELLSQFDDAKECLRLMGLHVLELPGYEADDLQGTVAGMAHGRDDVESYILSGDRDLLQLIDEKITVLLATNTDTLTMREAEFTEKYGVTPTQFVDMKALMGDSSDNIPGVAGIGEKTAATLIQNFSSLEGIYENIEDKRISKGVREKLLRDRDNAYLSRTLAKIITDAPLEGDLESLATLPRDEVGLYKKFTELELNSLIQKFGLTGKTEADAGVADAEAFATSFTDIMADELDGISDDKIALEVRSGEIYISADGRNLRLVGGRVEFSRWINGKSVICYDGKAQLHALDKMGIDATRVKFLDLMLYAYVINPGSGHGGVEALASMFLGKSVESGTVAVGLFSELEHVLRCRVAADGLEFILDEIELPLLKLLYKIERRGFRINTAGILEFGEALGALADDLTASIYMRAGHEFNINSPKQMGEVLYVEMGLPCPKKTKSGYSTDAETLEQLRAESPIIDDILEYRQVTKLRGTYTTALTDVADAEGRIHTDFKQALTATGRLSSAEPNLQNIPIRTKMGRELRRHFIAKEGYALVDADYSQIELRLLAHISGDYTMSEAFLAGEDIHRKTAAAVFGVPEEAVNDEMRKRAKAVNFGIVYGIGGFSLAKDIGTTVKEATKYIKSYMMNYPSIEEYLERVVKDAEERGYTVTEFGRRRYIPELKASNANMRAFGKRVAMNAPIQGTAADVMKIAMLRVADRLEREGLDAEIVMQVHDELIVETRLSDLERCKEILREEMESAASFSVPLTVDVTAGANWLEQE